MAPLARSSGTDGATGTEGLPASALAADRRVAGRRRDRLQLPDLAERHRDGRALRHALAVGPGDRDLGLLHDIVRVDPQVDGGEPGAVRLALDDVVQRRDRDRAWRG